MEKNDPQSWPGDSTPDWDSTDEASWESFPASDPPAGSITRVGRGVCRENEPERCRAQSMSPDEAEHRGQCEALDDEHRGQCEALDDEPRCNS